MVKSAASTLESGGQGSDSKKANDMKQMLRYLDALTNEDCKSLLENLRAYDPNTFKGRAGDASTKSPQPKSLDDYMSQMADACDEEVQLQLYKEARFSICRRKNTLRLKLQHI